MYSEERLRAVDEHWRGGEWLAKSGWQDLMGTLWDRSINIVSNRTTAPARPLCKRRYMPDRTAAMAVDKRAEVVVDCNASGVTRRIPTRENRDRL